MVLSDRFAVLLAFVVLLTASLTPFSASAQLPTILSPFEKALKAAEKDPQEQAKIKKMCFYTMPNFGNEENQSAKCLCNWERAHYGEYREVTYDCFRSEYIECMSSEPSPICYNRSCTRCLGRIRRSSGEPITERFEIMNN